MNPRALEESAPKAGSGVVVDHRPWDQVLSRIVRPEGVDYLEARSRYMPVIDSYIEGLSRIRVESLDRDERLAYWMNLYNAALVSAVAQRYSDGYRVDESDFLLLDEIRVSTAVQLLSLKDLRGLACSPELAEPRAFIGLTLAARGGPALADRAYRGDTVRQALLQRTGDYVRSSTRFTEYNGRERVQLSPLFEWNQAGFGGLGDTLVEVTRHHDVDFSTRRYEFLRFDWSLDLAPPARGRWVRVIEGRAELRRSPDGPAQGWVGRKRVFECVEDVPGYVRVLLPPRHEPMWLSEEAVGPWPREAQLRRVVSEPPADRLTNE